MQEPQSRIISRFQISVIFLSLGSLSHATKTLSGKGIRPINMLFQVTMEMNVPVNIMFNLLDAYVLSILNHSREVFKSRGYRTCTEKVL